MIITQKDSKSKAIMTETKMYWDGWIDTQLEHYPEMIDKETKRKKLKSLFHKKNIVGFEKFIIVGVNPLARKNKIILADKNINSTKRYAADISSLFIMIDNI